MNPDTDKVRIESIKALDKAVKTQPEFTPKIAMLYINPPKFFKIR